MDGIVNNPASVLSSRSWSTTQHWDAISSQTSRLT